jgi:saxitoxin biosynthesis operon SxtJ-like protein
MMKASDIPELDTRGLREFGITTGAILAVLFGGVFPYFLDRPWPVWPWVVFAVLSLWAIVAPNTLKPIYHGWMRLGMLLGRITTPIIMTLVFAITIVPMALLLRIFRRDFMRRKFDESPSYRVKSRPPSIENMEKPY